MQKLLNHFKRFETLSTCIFGIISAPLSINAASVSARRIELSSIGLSVCRSVRKVYCGKTAEWIRMTFGMVSGVRRGISVLDVVHVPPRGKGGFEGLAPFGFNGLFLKHAHASHLWTDFDDQHRVHEKTVHLYTLP